MGKIPPRYKAPSYEGICGTGHIYLSNRNTVNFNSAKSLQLIGSILLNIYAEFLARQDSIGDKVDAWACGILCTIAAFPSTPLANQKK